MKQEKKRERARLIPENTRFMGGTETKDNERHLSFHTKKERQDFTVLLKKNEV